MAKSILSNKQITFWTEASQIDNQNNSFLNTIDGAMSDEIVPETFTDKYKNVLTLLVILVILEIPYFMWNMVLRVYQVK